VFYPAGHRTELVERPAQSDGGSVRHATIGGPQSADPAAHGWVDDASASFAADSKPHQACGDGSSGTGARTARSLLGQPRIHCLAAEPDVIERQGAEAEL